MAAPTNFQTDLSNPDQQQAVAQQLEGQKNEARRQQVDIQTKGEQWQKKSRKMDASLDEEYPHPISLRVFFAFGFICALQDLFPIILDLLGVGWIVAYLTVPLVAFAFWYLIYRHAPQPADHKQKIKRQLLKALWLGGAELVPFLGEILPAWTVFAIACYYIIVRYERQRSIREYTDRAKLRTAGSLSKGGAKTPGASAQATTASKA